MSTNFQTLNIYYQNVRGLKTKLSTTFLLSQHTDFDVLCLTETFLDSSVMDTEIFDSNIFAVFRTDRSRLNSLKKTGGGVLIAVRNMFPAAMIDLLHDDVEMISVKLKLPSFTVYLFSVYIPPSMSSEVYKKCSDNIASAIENCNPEDRFVVCGDFNLPEIDWMFCEEDNCEIPVSPNSDKADDFLSSLSSLSLHQVNNICNHMNRMLDLVLCDDPNEIKVLENTNLLPLDIYHPALNICLESSLNFSATKKVYESSAMVYDFKKSKIVEMINHLSEIDWPTVLSCNDVNVDTKCFNDILYDAFEKFIPKRKVKKFDNMKPWMNDELKRLKNKKNKLHKSLKKEYDENVNREYLKVSKEMDAKLKLAYDNYISKVKSEIIVEPTNFWNFINIKRKVSANPSSIIHLGEEICGDQQIGDHYADFYQTVYKCYPRCEDRSFVEQSLSFGPPVLCPGDIEKALKDVKCSYVPGPDNVPATIVKKCSSVLSEPLCYLFNLSLTTGIFPEVWKSSFLIPLFKSGDRRLVSNYRGIAKLNVIPKLFESCIYESMFFNVKTKISSKQHGFLRGKSIQTNLLSLTNHITNSFSQKLQTDVGYFDFSKAFDQVHHELLLKKLQSFGFSNIYIKWIKSYLTGRTQRVTFNNFLSKNIEVTSGVPQGSHLGPLFFLMFINDLPECIQNCEILLYADDAKIFYSYDDVTGSDVLQSDISNLCDWCDNNYLSLNVKKCKMLTFTRRKNWINYKYNINLTDIERVYEFKDLGVLFDPKLSFSLHIESIHSKAKSRLGMIKRWSKEFNDWFITKCLFVSLVRSILEFASVVWSPSYMCHKNKIESVQKQFLIFVLKHLSWRDSFHLPPYRHRLLLIEMNTLEDRRIMLNVVFLTKLLDGKIDCPEILSTVQIYCPLRVSRNYNFLRIKLNTTNYLNNEPLTNIQRDFNALYPFFNFHLSIDVIKKNILYYFKELQRL